MKKFLAILLALICFRGETFGQFIGTNSAPTTNGAGPARLYTVVEVFDETPIAPSVPLQKAAVTDTTASVMVGSVPVIILPPQEQVVVQTSAQPKAYVYDQKNNWRITSTNRIPVADWPGGVNDFYPPKSKQTAQTAEPPASNGHQTPLQSGVRRFPPTVPYYNNQYWGGYGGGYGNGSWNPYDSRHYSSWGWDVSLGAMSGGGYGYGGNFSRYDSRLGGNYSYGGYGGTPGYYGGGYSQQQAGSGTVPQYPSGSASTPTGGGSLPHYK